MARSAVFHSNVTVFTVAEPSIMDAILADRKLNSMIVTTLSPTVALVLQQDFKKFIDRLRSADYFPRVVTQ